MGGSRTISWATLRRSLVDRAAELERYIGGLRARSARSDDGFSRALEICQAYASTFGDQVKHDWEHAADESTRVLGLLDHLDSFQERARWIDQRFARGSQAEVPRALSTIARREFETHGLDNDLPVLTVGPPETFETHDSDLFEYLLDGLALSTRPNVHHLSAPRLWVISVPYIEGTRALWHPITLGHKLAHIRHHREKSLTRRITLTATFIGDEELHAWERLCDTWQKERPDDEDLRTILETWVNELLCDLNAVRMFGLAGVSAIAEFFSVLDPSGTGTAEQPTPLHPPATVRLDVLFRFLRVLKYTEYPSHVLVWEKYSRRATTSYEPPFDFLARVVQDDGNVAKMMGHVLGWGPAYEFKHNQAIATIAQELLDGIPGCTHYAVDGEGVVDVRVADIVNGAWFARAALDASPRGYQAKGSDPAVIRSHAHLHQRRQCVDALATKAIDSIELSRLWGPEDGIVSVVDERIPSSSLPPGGLVLSGGEIGTRLRLERGDKQRLVVTPLFSDAIQTAAIDLRLGPDFIAFKHSSIAAFDPLADEDPRMLQELVHKAWGEQFILHPGELVLAATLEYIVVPNDLVAQVLTRSSYGRLGLITATAVQVQPGSRGCITLELVNLGETPIALSPGARVAQLTLSRLDELAIVEPGKYWFPVGPEFSKVTRDPDAGRITAIAKSTRVTEGPRLFRVGVDASADQLQVLADAADALRIATDKDRPATPIPVDPPAVSTMAASPLRLQAQVEDLAKFIVRARDVLGCGVRVHNLGDEIALKLVASDGRRTRAVGPQDEHFDEMPPNASHYDVADLIARLVGRFDPMSPGLSATAVKRVK